MVKRTVRRKIKNTVFGLLFTTLVFAVIILFAISSKNLLPLLKFGSEQKNPIVKPVSEHATQNSLSKILFDKNFIMESLAEGSSSGVIIGKIKDGPRVFFSQTRDAKWQVVSLELILNKLKIDNKEPSLIDFRYEQPIVKF